MISPILRSFVRMQPDCTKAKFPTYTLNNDPMRDAAFWNNNPAKKLCEDYFASVQFDWEGNVVNIQFETIWALWKEALNIDSDEVLDQRINTAIELRNNETLKLISKQPHLKGVHVTYGDFTNKGYRYLADSKSLKYLSLGSHLKDFNENSVDDETIKILATITTLENLFVEGYRPTEKSLNNLSKLSHLKQLTFNLGKLNKNQLGANKGVRNLCLSN